VLRVEVDPFGVAELLIASGHLADHVFLDRAVMGKALEGMLADMIKSDVSEWMRRKGVTIGRDEQAKPRRLRARPP
jgi:hypothetical protein